MAIYTSADIAWFIINALALICLAALIGLHFSIKEKSGIDWALFQIYILCFLSIISLLPLDIIYGNDLSNLIPIRGDWCVIQAQISHFFLLALRIFPGLLCLQLWLSIVKNDMDTKSRYILFGSIIIYTFCIIVTILQIILQLNQSSMGVITSRFYCTLQFDMIYAITMEIPSLICASIGFFLSLHAFISTLLSIKEFSNRPNRKTHLKRSMTIRLFIWTGFYTFLTSSLAINGLILMINSVKSNQNNNINNTKSDSHWIFHFAAPLSAIFMFLVLGSNNRVALFLPCFKLPNKNQNQNSSQHQISKLSSIYRDKSKHVLELNLENHYLDEKKRHFSSDIISNHSSLGSSLPQSINLNPFMINTKNAVKIKDSKDLRDLKDLKDLKDLRDLKDLKDSTDSTDSIDFTELDFGLPSPPPPPSTSSLHTRHSSRSTTLSHNNSRFTITNTKNAIKNHSQLESFSSNLKQHILPPQQIKMVQENIENLQISKPKSNWIRYEYSESDLDDETETP